MRISDWSSDVCSSDLFDGDVGRRQFDQVGRRIDDVARREDDLAAEGFKNVFFLLRPRIDVVLDVFVALGEIVRLDDLQVFDRFGVLVVYHLVDRSEEHTSDLLSLMRISYPVFCLKKKKNT